MPASPSASTQTAVFTIVAIACVLLAASFLGTPVPGTNEPHYLSKAKASADPGWVVNDFFLQSANAHAVFFAIVGPFAKWLPFAVVLAAGRIVSLLVVAIGLHSLCKAVGCDGRRAVISAALFYLIGRTGNFSGEWVIGGFESKVPAYGLALLGIAACIRNRTKPAISGYLLAGFFTGLAVAWHPVVGIWTAIAISMTEAWLWLRPDAADGNDVQGIASLLRRGVTFGLASMVFALPGLVPAFQMLLSSDVDLATKLEAKQIQVFYRLAHHLDPTRFPGVSWWHTGALIGVLSLTVFWVRRQNNLTDFGRSAKGNSVDATERLSRSEAYLLKFLACTAIIAFIGIAIGWHGEPVMELDSRHWRAALLQFYPFRLFDAFLPLTTAIFLSAIPIVQRKRVPLNDPLDEERLVTSTKQRWNPFQSNSMTAAIMIAICGAAAFATRPSSPSGYSPKLFTEWKQACAWLKDNTAADALIFAPRESFALKLFAERAEYVSFKDCPQDAGGIVEWNRRLWKLHRWSKQSYMDKVFSKEELTKLHQQTGIDYIFTRRLGPFSVPPVWEGKSWKIYPTTLVTAKNKMQQSAVSDVENQDFGTGGIK